MDKSRPYETFIIIYQLTVSYPRRLESSSAPMSKLHMHRYILPRHDARREAGKRSAL
jgi:hypothetical protein